MATVLLRFGGGSLPDEMSCTVPTLAELARRIQERPQWAQRDPLGVVAQTFAAAEKEMQSVRRRRGYGDLPRADIPQRNFLLFGVPIVCEEA